MRSSPSQRTSNGIVRSTGHGHMLSQVKTLARPVSVQSVRVGMDDVGEWLGSLVSSPLIPVFQLSMK